MEGKIWLERAAYHEAGHAVIALGYGYLIEEIFIQPETRFGMVMPSHTPMLRNWPAYFTPYHKVRFLLDLMNEIQVLLAGPIAEAEFSNQPHVELIMANEDFYSAVEHLSPKSVRELCEQYAVPSFSALIADTLQAVLHPARWRLIETLAEALMRQHCLTGPEVVSLLSVRSTDQLQLDIPMDEF